MNRRTLALLTLAVALGLAAVALGDYPMPVGLYVPGIQQWQSAPSTPTTVSASQGYVPMTGAAVTFTTPPTAGSTIDATFNVQFGASNANVANCIADIAITGYPSSSYGTAGYAQPSFALGGYVSTNARILDVLYGNTTYTVTPRVAAMGTGATCVVTGASFWMTEFGH